MVEDSNSKKPSKVTTRKFRRRTATNRLACRPSHVAPSAPPPQLPPHWQPSQE
jgi:hypothetical protein